MEKGLEVLRRVHAGADTGGGGAESKGRGEDVVTVYGEGG